MTPDSESPRLPSELHDRLSAAGLRRAAILSEIEALQAPGIDRSKNSLRKRMVTCVDCGASTRIWVHRVRGTLREMQEERLSRATFRCGSCKKLRAYFLAGWRVKDADAAFRLPT